MKKLFAGLIVLTLISFANSVAWLGNYDTALAKAKKEHKPLLVLLVKEGDTLSKDVVAKYFTNKAYVDRINKRVVAVIVYCCSSSRISYPIEMLYSKEFPTLFLVSSEMEVPIRRPLYSKEIDEKTLAEFFKDL